MLGFSLSKLVVLAAIIALVWYGFKWVGRVNRLREEREARAGAAGAKVEDGGGQGVEDMVKCEVCGTFVAARGARHCGREGCPYPR